MADDWKPDAVPLLIGGVPFLEYALHEVDIDTAPIIAHPYLVPTLVNAVPYMDVNGLRVDYGVVQQIEEYLFAVHLRHWQRRYVV